MVRQSLEALGMSEVEAVSKSGWKTVLLLVFLFIIIIIIIIIILCGVSDEEKQK